MLSCLWGRVWVLGRLLSAALTSPRAGHSSLGGELSASSQPAVLGTRDPSGSQLAAGSFLTIATRGWLPPL